MKKLLFKITNVTIKKKIYREKNANNNITNKSKFFNIVLRENDFGDSITQFSKIIRQNVYTVFLSIKLKRISIWKRWRKI